MGTLSSVAVYPRSSAIVRIDLRVTPGRIVPTSGGVLIVFPCILAALSAPCYRKGEENFTNRDRAHLDDEDVGSRELLKVGVGAGIKVHDVREALLLRRH